MVFHEGSHVKVPGPTALAVDVPHAQQAALKVAHPARGVEQGASEACRLQALPQGLSLGVVQAQLDSLQWGGGTKLVKAKGTLDPCLPAARNGTSLPASLCYQYPHMSVWPASTQTHAPPPPHAPTLSSYSLWLPTTISRASPVAVHREAATREAMRSSGSVTMGQPPHSTSQPVVCALQSGVSRNRSATPLQGGGGGGSRAGKEEGGGVD